MMTGKVRGIFVECIEAGIPGVRPFSAELYPWSRIR
jgi:hypothetical protein